MKIFAIDRGIVTSFLEREALDFVPSGDEKIAGFVTECWKQIDEMLEHIKEPADFICIQSMTNLGLVQRELKITPDNWSYKGKVMVFLPPSFRNPGVNVKFIEGE